MRKKERKGEKEGKNAGPPTGRGAIEEREENMVCQPGEKTASYWGKERPVRGPAKGESDVVSFGKEEDGRSIEMVG